MFFENLENAFWDSLKKTYIYILNFQKNSGEVLNLSLDDISCHSLNCMSSWNNNNGQTLIIIIMVKHSNNWSAICKRIVLVSLTILLGWCLKG